MFGSIFGGGQGMNQTAQDAAYNAAVQRAQLVQQAHIRGMEEDAKRSRTFFNIQVEVVGNGYMVDFGNARLIAKNLEEVAQHVVSTIAAAQLED